MFGIGPGELLVIGIIALLIVGPEKLPIMIRDGTRWVRDLRRMVESARQDITEQIGPELRDLGIDELRDLDPRQYVRRHVLDGLDDEPERGRSNGSTAAGEGDGASRGRSAAGRSRTPRPAGAPPSFDPDAT